MEKNVKVLDVNGQSAGFTYPKRAKGLVKNGRAEYVDDCTIRLLHTLSPDTIENTDSEGETQMSNVINFNARDFRFDKSCEHNVGTRMFITDMFNESVEVYEIGDGKDTVTQIQSVKTLDKNTEYAFRFAIITSKDLIDGDTEFIIVPIEGDNETEEDWENRYVYNLSQNQYKSNISKRWGLNLVRIYEIPFSTGEISKYRFVFRNEKAVARIFPAKENEAYDKLPDFSYEGWFNDRKEQFEQFGQNFDWEKTVKDAGEATKKATKKATKTVSEALDSLWGTIKNQGANYRDFKPGFDPMNINHVNENIQGEAFVEILKQMQDGCNVDFSGAVISAVETNEELKSCDGIFVNLKNAVIPKSAFSAFMKTVGDGAVLHLENVSVTEDESSFDFGSKADGITVIVTEASIPGSVWAKLYEKFGDGCHIESV